MTHPLESMQSYAERYGTTRFIPEACELVRPCTYCEEVEATGADDMCDGCREAEGSIA